MIVFDIDSFLLRINKSSGAEMNLSTKIFTVDKPILVTRVVCDYFVMHHNERINKYYIWSSELHFDYCATHRNKGIDDYKGHIWSTVLEITAQSATDAYMI